MRWGSVSVASAIALLCCAPPLAATPESSQTSLRVCADPNNLPFSNDRGEGLENKLADLVARDLGMTVSYTWWAQRRGFIRNTLKAGKCDVVIGTPALDMIGVTQPYYRSGYVFVSRASDDIRFTSLLAPELRTLRVGVQLIGDDGFNTPQRMRSAPSTLPTTSKAFWFTETTGRIARPAASSRRSRRAPSMSRQCGGRWRAITRRDHASRCEWLRSAGPRRSGRFNSISASAWAFAKATMH